jgi:hypothetical protein
LDIGTSIKHVSEYLFSIFESVSHLCVVAIEGRRKRVLASLTFGVDVCDEFLFAGEDDLRFIGEVDLHDFIAEAKHDGMFGFHPFLYVAEGGLFGWL